MNHPEMTTGRKPNRRKKEGGSERRLLMTPYWYARPLGLAIVALLLAVVFAPATTLATATPAQATETNVVFGDPVTVESTPQVESHVTSTQIATFSDYTEVTAMVRGGFTPSKLAGKKVITVKQAKKTYKLGKYKIRAGKIYKTVWNSPRGPIKHLAKVKVGDKFVLIKGKIYRVQCGNRSWFGHLTKKQRRILARIKIRIVDEFTVNATAVATSRSYLTSTVKASCPVGFVGASIEMSATAEANASATGTGTAQGRAAASAIAQGNAVQAMLKIREDAKAAAAADATTSAKVTLKGQMSCTKVEVVKVPPTVEVVRPEHVRTDMAFKACAHVYGPNITSVVFSMNPAVGSFDAVALDPGSADYWCALYHSPSDPVDAVTMTVKATNPDGEGSATTAPFPIAPF